MKTAPLTLGGFDVVRTTSGALSEQLGQSLDTNHQECLFFANTNFIVQCQPLQKEIAEAPCIIVNDGVGVDIATLIFHRKRFAENLNGTDFVPAFLHSNRQQARAFLYGAKPGIAQRAANKLRDTYAVNVVGVSDGYVKDQQALIEQINNSGANVVLVALGNPLQEKWILDNRHHLKANVFVAVGALFDFLAGDKARAPRLVQKLRLEWLYRLCLEPSRLLRRYTLDIAVFLALCLRTSMRT